MMDPSEEESVTIICPDGEILTSRKLFASYKIEECGDKFYWSYSVASVVTVIGFLIGRDRTLTDDSIYIINDFGWKLEVSDKKVFLRSNEVIIIKQCNFAQDGNSERCCDTSSENQKDWITRTELYDDDSAEHKAVQDSWTTFMSEYRKSPSHKESKRPRKRGSCKEGNVLEPSTKRVNHGNGKNLQSVRATFSDGEIETYCEYGELKKDSESTTRNEEKEEEEKENAGNKDVEKQNAETQTIGETETACQEDPRKTGDDIFVDQVFQECGGSDGVNKSGRENATNKNVVNAITDNHGTSRSEFPSEEPMAIPSVNTREGIPDNIRSVGNMVNNVPCCSMMSNNGHYHGYNFHGNFNNGHFSSGGYGNGNVHFAPPNYQENYWYPGSFDEMSGYIFQTNQNGRGAAAHNFYQGGC